ncbi:MAG TPA: nuclear transport factor 2 family protein, partial [Gammaproteobacteria bacterium]|nr:nuclear transport factor 2 family protein [Gammaproteobacteria bacterium]
GQPATGGQPSAEERLEAIGKRLQRLQDANDVETLQRAYGYFVDKGMWTEVANLFADDGTYEIGGRGVFVGKKRVLEYLQVGLAPERPVEGRLINHMQFQPITTISPDGRTAKERMKAFVASGYNWGDVIYENTYAKEDGVWKIKTVHAPFVMYTSVTKGWAEDAVTNTWPAKFPPPPDRPPTVVYLTYPSVYIVPFHYPNPVTGRPYRPLSESAAVAERGDILIDDKGVFPESVTSTSRGTIITGSLGGIIFRAEPGDSVAEPWIRSIAQSGGRTVYGVLADERTDTLWVCTAPNPFQRPARPEPSSLLAFDLDSGAKKGAYPLPAPAGACNDVAVSSEGTVYATDTPKGRILALQPGAAALNVFADDPRLNGVDGLAFGGDGMLYVDSVTRNELLRVDMNDDGTLHAITPLALSQPIEGPDGLRPIAANRFLLAEGGGGRIDEVTVRGDKATIRVLKSGLKSSPGVTLAGDTVYAVEGKIGYLTDPALKGQDPGEFKVLAVAETP